MDNDHIFRAELERMWRGVKSEIIAAVLEQLGWPNGLKISNIVRGGLVRPDRISGGPVMSNPMTTEGDMIRGGASGTATRLAPPAVGQVLIGRGSPNPNPTWESQDVTINFVIDGGGQVITTGNKGYIVVDFAATILSATLLADQAGSIVVDVWKDTYANFPPTDADSITASAPPTLSGAQKSQDTTLTGWTTSIAAGEVLAFNVDSASTVQRVTLALKVRRA